MWVSQDKEVSLGQQSFQQVLAEETPSQNQQYVEMVNRVGQRIAAVAGRPDFQWEFKVIASQEMNAFCLPGGKVAIYEGILPICQSEAGLAVVMSHEIAHALARHGSERMSHSYAVDSVGKAVNYVLQNNEADMQQKVAQAYGMASKYGVILPYSRKHETEADYIGMLLMAKAGYDPREAPRFWDRFSQHSGNSQPEFLSTHPADERRAHDLFEKLPEAIDIYDNQTEPANRVGQGQPLQIARTESSVVQ
ncbi:MAG: M48 family metallopeptidase [Pirellulaceae bacterium]